MTNCMVTHSPGETFSEFSQRIPLPIVTFFHYEKSRFNVKNMRVFRGSAAILSAEDRKKQREVPSAA